jgi:hypothetical protein
MEITIGSKVKHIPSGDIVTVEKINPKSYLGSSVLHPFAKVRPLKSDCEIYIEPVKEKSFYEKMRERNIEDANKLPASPKEIGQHLLWLKAAAIYRIETLDKRTDDKIYTFKQKVGTDDYGKFGFSEHYLNLLMHYAYEAGKNNATESLTRTFTQSTNSMKHAIDAIINALDTNDLLPENEFNTY